MVDFPPEIAQVHATVLSKANYHLKTALKISEISYSHSPKLQVYGTGQGTVHPPILWALTSSILFALYSQLSHGATIIDCNSTDKFSITGFVDDASNYTM